MGLNHTVSYGLIPWWLFYFHQGMHQEWKNRIWRRNWNWWKRWSDIRTWLGCWAASQYPVSYCRITTTVPRKISNLHYRIILVDEWFVQITCWFKVSLLIDEIYVRNMDNSNCNLATIFYLPYSGYFKLFRADYGVDRVRPVWWPSGIPEKEPRSQRHLL